VLSLLLVMSLTMIWCDCRPVTSERVQQAAVREPCKKFSTRQSSRKPFREPCVKLSTRQCRSWPLKCLACILPLYQMVKLRVRNTTMIPWSDFFVDLHRVAVDSVSPGTWEKLIVERSPPPRRPCWHENLNESLTTPFPPSPFSPLPSEDTETERKSRN